MWLTSGRVALPLRPSSFLESLQAVWPPNSKPARGDNSIAIDSPFRPADADEDCADIQVLPQGPSSSFD